MQVRDCFNIQYFFKCKLKLNFLQIMAQDSEYTLDIKYVKLIVMMIIAIITLEISTNSPKKISRIKTIDQKLGRGIFTFTSKSSSLKLLAEVFSFLGDELIWFGVPTVFGVIISFTRLVRWLAAVAQAVNWQSSLMAEVPTMGCVEESLWDMFGFSATCILVETGLKNLFRRNRPEYAVQQLTGYAVPGEWYSFPSGHALRSFYIPFWISRNMLVKTLFSNFRARFLLPLSFGVGWSRIAKGRHYPLDVFFGSLLGVVLGFVVEDVCNDKQRAVVKTISGIFLVLAFGSQYLYTYVGVTSGKMCLYICYFSLIFFITLPIGQWEALGLQTLSKIDGRCKSFF